MRYHPLGGEHAVHHVGDFDCDKRVFGAEIKGFALVSGAVLYPVHLFGRCRGDDVAVGVRRYGHSQRDLRFERKMADRRQNDDALHHHRHHLAGAWVRHRHV